MEHALAELLGRALGSQTVYRVPFKSKHILSERGGHVAERLGNRDSDQKIAGSIPDHAK